MADNIQSLTFPVNTTTPGVIKTYKAEVNKQNGAMVVYDTTNLLQKDAVLRSDPATVDGKRLYKTDFVGTPSTLDKQFLLNNVSPAANNQRAAYINKNFTPEQKNTLFSGMPGVTNTATTSSSPDQQGGNGTDQQRNTPGGSIGFPIPKVDDKNEKVFPNISILTYPIKMADTQQDRIKFSAVEYLAPGVGQLGVTGLKGPNRKNPRKQVGPTVFLPIQSGINDSNSVDWQGGNLNEIDRRVANLALNSMEGGVKDLTSKFSEAVTQVMRDIGVNEGAIRVALAGEAAGVQNLLGRFGAVLNPNLELLFTGPQLRPFSFNFRLSAREEEEAKTIKNIIKFFKLNMATKKTPDGIFLRSPNTFFIEYQYGKDKTKPHPGINLIKECALVDCSVDYTPNGTYMTYEDGTMVTYTMSLSFQELEPIYDEDYNGHAIGY